MSSSLNRRRNLVAVTVLLFAFAIFIQFRFQFITATQFSVHLGEYTTTTQTPAERFPRLSSTTSEPPVSYVDSLIGSDTQGHTSHSSSPSEPLVSYVDPFIGTGAQGHTYPGATVPFGMVQLSPDNGARGWEYCSGYHVNSTTIVGFSHTHLSGTGIGDLLDISIIPTTPLLDDTTAVDNDSGGQGTGTVQHTSGLTFSHDDEVAEPGYYKVVLSNGVTAELTTTERIGMHRYTFPASLMSTAAAANASLGIRLDLGFGFNDRPMSTLINIQPGNTTAHGFRKSQGWAQDHCVYFAMELSEPCSEYTLSGGTVDGSEVEGSGASAHFLFNAANTTAKKNKTIEKKKPFQVLIKVGLSSANVTGAEAALLQSSSDVGWDFDLVRKRATELWEAELRKVVVTSDDIDKKKTFYTALYHSKLAPTIHSDIHGRYKAPNGQIMQTNGFDYYSTFSIWDTFRAAHPLLTILNPDRAIDMLRTLLAHADEMQGILPIWTLAGSETRTMPGFHAVVMLLEGLEKGLLKKKELPRIYKAMNISSRNPERRANVMHEYSFIPSTTGSFSVTLTMELAYDMWCVGKTAEKLGKTAEAEYFYGLSKAYQRVFDKETGFMRAKQANGKWRESSEAFNPFFSDHERGDYTEGTAYQYLTFVPHDVQGMMTLFGGPAQFEAKLDELFTADSRIDGEGASVDISGMIGQYAHGNEPSHHVAYLYNYVGAPHKTQAMVRKILTEQYSPTVGGLAGNEDCGQISAWYLFSALGFYPVNPAEATYQLGSPLFDHAVIDVGNGKQFEIRAPGADSQRLSLIRSVKLNGKLLDRTYLEHAEVVAGGVLEFEMMDRVSSTVR